MHACIYAYSKILIDEFPGDEVQAIPRFKFQCTNITFAYQIGYNIMIQQVINKGGESSLSYIKIFQNAKALSISVGNIYTENQLMHTFLDNYQKFGKYSTQIVSHQEKLWREEKIID